MNCAHPFDARAANELAYCCARAVVTGLLDARSPIADALLDYLRIGEPGGPPDVITWMRDYEAASTPEDSCSPTSTLPRSKNFS